MDLFMETSAKTGFNAVELFCRAAKILYEESIKKREVNKVSKKYFFNFYFGIQDIDPEILNQVKLNIQDANIKKKKKCC